MPKTKIVQLLHKYRMRHCGNRTNYNINIEKKQQTKFTYLYLSDTYIGVCVLTLFTQS